VRCSVAAVPPRKKLRAVSTPVEGIKEENVDLMSINSVSSFFLSQRKGLVPSFRSAPFLLLKVLDQSGRIATTNTPQTKGRVCDEDSKGWRKG
jgi:hypothetical protein